MSGEIESSQDKEIEIISDENGMFNSKQGSDEGKQDISKFYGYYIYNRGILLYPQKNLFYVLKRDFFQNEDFKKILELFSKLELNKL